MPPSVRTVCEALDRIAPVHLAQHWDNVGLLVSPPGRSGAAERRVRRIMLAVDLTAGVVEEAREGRVEMIVCYHPPVFRPLTRLVPGEGKARLLMRCVQAGIAIYSPHTALDAAAGGVTDWLVEGLGDLSETRALEPAEGARERKIVVFVPENDVDHVRNALSGAGAGVIGAYTHCSFNIPGTGTFLGGAGTNPAIGRSGRLEEVSEIRLEMVAPEERLGEIARVLERVHPYEEPAWDLYDLAPRKLPGRGTGRVAALRKPASLPTLVRRIKRHLDLKHLRLAAAPGYGSDEARVRNVAAVPGAGGSVLAGVRGVEAVLTGEMRHHDVLDLVAAGINVLLCGHTATERGYLPRLRKALVDALGERVSVELSGEDVEIMATV